MTAAERAWVEARIVEWGEQAALWRRIACTRTGPLNRARGLDSVVRGLQARLDAAPRQEEDPLPNQQDGVSVPRTATDAALLPQAGEGEARDAPIAGDVRERHLRSAAVCRKLGQEAAARAFEDLAEGRVAVPARPKRTIFERMSEIAAASRLPQPPARDPVPFTAGPQMEMFG